MEEQLKFEESFDSTDNLISFDEESPDFNEKAADLPSSLPPLKSELGACSSSVKYSDYNHKGSIGWITCHVHCCTSVLQLQSSHLIDVSGKPYICFNLIIPLSRFSQCRNKCTSCSSKLWWGKIILYFHF